MRLFTNWRKEKFNMRLTERKRNSDGTGVAKQNLIKDNGRFTRFTDEILTKLAEYEDLEERGRLVKLSCDFPCKIEDTVYRTNAGAKEPIIAMRITQVLIKQLKDRTVITFNTINDNDNGENCYTLEDVGVKVFLTKEEAELKLAELRGGTGVAKLNLEEVVKIAADKMTYADAVHNAMSSKYVPCREATNCSYVFTDPKGKLIEELAIKIKLKELLEIAKSVDESKAKGCDEISTALYYDGFNDGHSKALDNLWQLVISKYDDGLSLEELAEEIERQREV